MIKKTHLLRPNALPNSYSLAIVCISSYLQSIPESLLLNAKTIFILQYKADCPTAVTLSTPNNAQHTIPVLPFDKLRDEIEFDILFFHPEFSTMWLGASAQHLRGLGIESYYIWMPTPHNRGICTTHDSTYYPSNKTALDNVFDRLADEVSRRIFASRIRALTTGNIGYIELSEYPQYFHPLVQPSLGDIVIDGGVSENINQQAGFIKAVGDTGKIYGFEPDPIGFEKARESLKKHDAKGIFQLIPSGLWHKRDTLHFDLAGDGTHVSHQGSPDSCPCEVISVDEFVDALSLKKVDLIKLDVEGAEVNVIKGAIKTITRFKPKLAISLYHAPKDLYYIPRLLLELDPQYKIYIGHHHACLYETILYARRH
ncbi:MAG: FkbM family methyltransferase [Proteobacteria bacterium]|nr:FkbM family methyltransferase [Pseudomonadota bacterium]